MKSLILIAIGFALNPRAVVIYARANNPWRNK